MKRFVLLGAAMLLILTQLRPSEEAERRANMLGGAPYPFVERDPGCGCSP